MAVVAESVARQCYDCKRPATEGFKSCARCREQRRQQARRNPNHRKQSEAWRLRNLARYRATHNRWQARQWRENPAYVVIALYRRRLAKVFRVHRSDGITRTKELIGCTPTELVAYLEKQFQTGMTWGNRGSVWHIDHKRPIASFDLSDVEQRKQCFHYTNLQPLFAHDNQVKWAHWS